MYQLKPFITKTAKTSGLPITECFIGDIRIGSIVENLMTRKNKEKYVFRFEVIVDPIDQHIFADTVEELQDQALNKFRSFVCNILL